MKGIGGFGYANGNMIRVFATFSFLLIVSNIPFRYIYETFCMDFNIEKG